MNTTEVGKGHLTKQNDNKNLHIHQQSQKRKHRRGKPKSKNGNNLNKAVNNTRGCNAGGAEGRGSFGIGDAGRRRRLVRSRSMLVPYNTNKFLMEEHMPPALLSPTRRTRDSSFSLDSDENYSFSLPEGEVDFLTREFVNVYERTRRERWENMEKQQLIEELLQIEDRYTNGQENQFRTSIKAQCMSLQLNTKIRSLEDKIKELTRENYNLRCQLIRSATLTAAAAASPPSAAPPMGAVCEPTPMDSASEDSESDSSSSSTTSSTSASSSSSSVSNDDNNDNEDDHDINVNDIGLNIINGNAKYSPTDDAEERCGLLDAQMVDDESNPEFLDDKKQIQVISNNTSLT